MFETHPETWLVSDHPVCAASEASRYFLSGAATPPLGALGGGEWRDLKSLLNKYVILPAPGRVAGNRPVRDRSASPRQSSSRRWIVGRSRPNCADSDCICCLRC